MNEAAAVVPVAPDERLEGLRHWLRTAAGLPEFSIVPASGDASFRRYFRVRFGDRSLIAVDAPPVQEDSRPFIKVATMLGDIGLNVPRIVTADPDRGFMLITDLGVRLYLGELDDASADRLYGDALGALATLQTCAVAEGVLPPYDRALLMREMALFRDWYLERHLGIGLDDARERLIAQSFETLCASALEQPVVCVHRDYHSRNLMVCEGHNPGILDFQDAVAGPVTYDLVSLLRDCYIAWPRSRVEDWATGYFELAVQSGVLRQAHEADFLRWFDAMGVQRHLKATGIFARLWHRDGKPGYLDDVPRTLGYVTQVCAGHPALAAFGRFVEDEVLPRHCGAGR